MWIRSPSSPSVPGEVASTWDSTSLSQALARSVGWSGKPSPPRTWLTRCTRMSWMKRLCGQIYTPSMADRGVAQWISSLRATRANRSATLAAAVAQTIRATCGPRFIESSKRFVPPSSFWRMSQGTLALDSAPSLEISTHQVTELRRLSSLRRMWARATNESDFSSSEWPTPRAITGGPESTERKQELGRTESGSGDLQAASVLWPTPNHHDARRPTDPHSTQTRNLQREADQWPTPDASLLNDGESPEQWDARKARHAQKAQNPTQAGPRLAIEAQRVVWPTPTAGDALGAGSRNTEGSKANPGVSLTDLVLTGDSTSGRGGNPKASRSGRPLRTPRSSGESFSTTTPTSPPPQSWATPAARDTKGANDLGNMRAKLENGHRGFQGQLANQVVMENWPTDSTPAAPTSRPRLNPKFVAWLMGWHPIGPDGTCYVCSATVSSPCRPRMRSHFWQLVSW